MSRNGESAHLRLPSCVLAALWRQNAWTTRRWPTICAALRTGRRYTPAVGLRTLQDVELKVPQNGRQKVRL